jgi:translation initiation factor 2 gamma subunit (eIF-2gamma)
MRNPGSFTAPKFPECRDCKFFSRRARNPICGDCGAGEHFEERVRVREADAHDLMSMFARMNHE